MPTEKSRKILGTRFIRLTEEGETYTGKLVGREPVVINGNDTYRYTFMDGQGKASMNGTDQLDDALSDAELGIWVEVKFLESQLTLGGFNVKRFEVCLLTMEDEIENTGKAKAKAN